MKHHVNQFLLTAPNQGSTSTQSLALNEKHSIINRHRGVVTLHQDRRHALELTIYGISKEVRCVAQNQVVPPSRSLSQIEGQQVI